MSMATLHVSAFNNPLDGEAPAPTRDRISFHILADVTYTWSRATWVSPQESSLIVNRIRHMDVEFDVASTEGGYGEDGLQGDRQGDTYDWEITDSDSALKLLEAWGIDLESETDWDFGDHDEMADARADYEGDMIDDAYERGVQAELRGDA